MKRDFLSLRDLSQSEIETLLDRAMTMKAERIGGHKVRSLAGLNVGMIFNKPSVRTRVSFEVGVNDLGGRIIHLSEADTKLSRREPITHAARVLSRYLDALVVRTYSQDELATLAEYASIPVINALTDLYHPCQVLSDLMTIKEKKNDFSGLKVAWVGDGHNMANSWLNAAARLDFQLTLAIPEGYDPDPEVLSAARAQAARPVRITRDPLEAVTGAEVINTDVWASMGQEAEAAERNQVFKPYQINQELMARASSSAIVLHCLPAHLEEEITAEVLEGPQSVVFDQAENRLHAQKALMELIIPGQQD